MWVLSGQNRSHSFMREDVGDRSERQHDEAESSLRRVEAVGPIDDEADPTVEAFMTRVVDAETDGGQDAVLVLSQRLGQSDEGLEAAALCPRAEAVEKLRDLVLVEIAGEDLAQGFLEPIGA